MLLSQGKRCLLGFALIIGVFSGRLAVGQDVGSGEPTGSPTDSTSSRGAFTASLSYGSNSSFFGRTQTTRYPYLAGDLIYKTKAGIWGSVTSYNLFNTTTFIDETDLAAGWDFDLSKSVDASVSYSHFLFAPNSPLVKSSVNNSLDGYIGLDWKYIYTRLNAAYLFGTSQDAFVILDNSRYFGFDNVLTAKGYLSVEPRLSATAGTQHFVVTSLEQQLKRNGNNNGKGGGNGNGNGNNGNGNGGGNGNGNGNGGGNGGGNSGTTTVTTYTTGTRFKILNYELRVPITYSLGIVSWQVAWRYTVPVNLLSEDISGARSYFTTTLSLNL